MIKRGALIVFEGCDRSGKTTQCQRAMKWFEQNDKQAYFMRFPGFTHFYIQIQYCKTILYLIFCVILDRTTVIGSLINKYLVCNTELEDHAIHLLFSANRWELMYGLADIHTFIIVIYLFLYYIGQT